MLILWLPGIFELVFSITTVCENDSSSHFPNYLYKNQNCAPAKTACDSSFVRTVTLPRDATVIEQQGLPAGINCQEPIGFLSNILTVGPSVKKIVRIADALGVLVADLFLGI